MTNGWEEILSSVKPGDWISYRRALAKFRSSGPSFDQVTAMGEKLSGSIPGLPNAPSRTTWANCVQEVNRPIKWAYIELLVHIWAAYHRIPGKQVLETLELWSSSFRVCGGDPGPRFPAIIDAHENGNNGQHSDHSSAADAYAKQNQPSPPSTNPLNQLVAAQERTIMALKEVNSLKDAYATSEKARQEAVQVGSMALALLGEARAEVARLHRKIDVLEYTLSSSESRELRNLYDRLKKAEDQETDLRAQLERAERDRDKYQQIADFAARRLAFLENELNHTYTTSEVGALDYFSSDGRTSNHIDDAIAKLNDHLNRQDDDAQKAADSIGWNPNFRAEGGHVSEFNGAGLQPPRSDSASRVLSLAQQTADQAIAEARSEANKIIAQAKERAAEIMNPDDDASES
ncbi:hypothetical protein [Streptomyces tuirus]|uniref:DivIVA domain-containing protein n=1 Tax=Streptomyces tuirus TaxID=68278 RepID=UPI003F4DD10E